MALFNFMKKKQEPQQATCGSCEGCTLCGSQQQTSQYVKVLGSGCAKCNELEENTKKALAIMGMKTEVEHVTDFTKIAEYGVMTTPALVIDGKVVSFGKVLKTEEVVEILKNI